MGAYKDRDGTIWAPARAEGPGGAIGDGLLPLRPGDPEYDDYDRILAWYAEQGIVDDEDDDEDVPAAGV